MRNPIRDLSPEDRALERHAVDLVAIRARLGRPLPHTPDQDA